MPLSWKNLAMLADLAAEAYPDVGFFTYPELPSVIWQTLDWAELASFSQAGDPIVEADFDGPYFARSNNAVFAAYSDVDNQLVISIRGTDDIADWGDYPGLAVAINAVVEEISSFVAAIHAYAENERNAGETVNIYITGHSLGGAVAEAIARASPSLYAGGAFIGSPGSLNFAPGSLNDNFVHVTRNTDFVGQVLDDHHAANTLVIDDYEFLGTIPPLFGVIGQSHSHTRYAAQLAAMAESPLSRLFQTSAVGEVAFLEDDQPNILTIGTLVIGHGIDRLVFGGRYNDTISAAGFGDYVILDGGLGHDSLIGSDFNDALSGGLGMDALSGGAGNDTLMGGYAGDTYSIGVNQGADIINDSGIDGQDTIRFYSGSAFPIINFNWFSVDPNGLDLLVRAFDGANNLALDIRIQNMGTSAGAIELFNLYSGDGTTLTQSWDLANVWAQLSQPLPPGSFVDHFARTDGPLGNGWSLSPQDEPNSVVISNGVVTTTAVGGPNQAFYRALDLAGAVAATATLTDQSGFGALRLRHSTSFLFGSNGDQQSGYGIQVGRGDQNFNDSAVYLLHDGVLLATAVSTFQFGQSIKVEVTYEPDGRISGVISGDGNQFAFDFGPRAIQLAGSNFQIELGAVDPRTPILIFPTIDDVVLSSTPFSNDAPSPPADPGPDAIVLTDAVDSWIGVGTAETVWAKAGSDSLNGAGGSDTLFGGAGNDSISGGDGNDQILGDDNDTQAGDDFIEGGAGNDLLVGLSGNDILVGGSGDDALVGGAGHDILDGGTGVDWIDGGSGGDNVGLNLADETQAVNFVLSSAMSASGFTFVDGTHVRNIESFSLQTGSGDDQVFVETLIGQGANNQGLQNYWFAGAGNDRLVADFSSTVETVTLGYFNFNFTTNGHLGIGPASQVGLGIEFPAMLSFDGVDAFAISGGAAADSLYGGSGADIFNGNGGNDFLYGNGGDDTLSGGEGNDLIYGVEGDDALSGGSGADNIDGGIGVDTASYATALAGVAARLLTPASNTGDAAGDTYAAIENLRGSAFSDILGGDDTANTLYGDAGADTLLGQGGNDVLIGGAGADVLGGGAGSDAADYSASGAAVNVSLATGAGLGGDAQGDTLFSIEIVTGSAFADTLSGRDFVTDTLNGGDGDDVLMGRYGGDVLNGGAGIDTIVYTNSLTGVDVRLFNGLAIQDIAAIAAHQHIIAIAAV